MLRELGSCVKTSDSQFEVIEDDDYLNERDCFGYTTSKEDGSRVLLVHSKLSKDYKIETFWEEFWHSVLFDNGFERQARSESLVRRLAKETHAVLKKNKKVRELYANN